MGENSVNVEEVVREVLARLANKGTVPFSEDGKGDSPPAELAVGSRVVTLAEVGGRLDGIRRLVVLPQAVVTPSVRDELHRRNVALVYGQAAAAGPARQVRLVMLAVGPGLDAAALTNALRVDCAQIEPQNSDCLIAATDQLAAELARDDTLGLLVTAYPAAAVCLANRHRGVRAILGTDAAAVAADGASVGANLLVVPANLGVFRMKQIVGQFCREGPRACPAVFRERLA